MDNQIENSDTAFQLTVLGCRGSMPVSGEDFIIYGGETSCYKILAGNEEIYLDAGNGILNAATAPDTRITILLTHMHLDHIIGLPFFVALGQANRQIDIFAKSRSGLTAHEALDRLISPPFWPLKVDQYPANVFFHELPEESFQIGKVTVNVMEGIHPQGVTIYRLTYRGKSLVYATDFEHTPEGREALENFAKDCDLLIYDAQYNGAEYNKYRGYGHSTPQVGLDIGKKANAKKILFVHHDPKRTDKQLSNLEKELSKLANNFMFAKVGDRILF